MSNERLESILTDLASKMVKRFTRFHSDLNIAVSVLQKSVTMTISAHADDTRKLIGGEGVNFRAMRTVFTCIVHRHQRSLRFIVEEPKTGTKMPLTDFTPAKNWDAAPTMELLQEVCSHLFNVEPAIRYYPQGNDTSSFEVIVAAGEQIPVDDDMLGDALSRIFNAIGKSAGRKLYVDLARNDTTTTNENESRTNLADRVPSQG